MKQNGQQPHFTIIILKTQCPHCLRSSLDVLRSFTQRHYDVFVLGGDEDPDHSDHVSFLDEPGDTFAGNVNFAVRRARGEYVVICTDRVVPGRDWDIRFAAAGGHDTIPDILEPAYVAKNAPENTGTLGIVSGECLVINRSVFDTIGGFDERFALKKTVIDEFCHRAEKTGFSCSRGEGFTAELLELPESDEHDPAAERNDRIKFNAKYGLEGMPSAGESKFFTRSSSDQELSDDDCMRLFEEGNRLIVELRIEEGLQRYRRILEARPNHIQALHNESAVLYQAGKKQEGLKGLEKVIRIDPTYAETYYTLGFIRESEGDPHEAIRLYRECIARDITHEKAFEGYERIAAQIGKNVIEEPVDFVFYTGGFSTFDGSTITKKSLGGSESALYYVARHIAAKGYVVKVFNHCDTPGVYENVEYRDLVDFYLYNRWNTPRIFISSRSFKPVFNNIRAGVTIVWLHDWPNVVYLDEYDFSKIDFSRLKLFTLSESQTTEWKKVVGIPDETFYVTRNGFDPERFRPLDIPRKKNRLIYASRPIRGLDILLEIFPRISEAVPDAELHVFSYVISKRDNEIDAFRERLDQPGVVFRGSVPQEQLGRELAEARLLSYPGIFKETSCIIAIQAQAAGLPVITTKLAALPETVQHENGGIIIEGDPHSDEYKEKFIRETVRLMQDDEAWRELSEAGRRRMEQYYTWEHIAEEWLSYIASLPGSGIQVSTREKSDEPKLSLCMIVKNEEQNLPVCLESVREIVDEIIVVDSGSTDNTIEVAKRYGAVVHQYEWNDDFAAARNESIRHASGDWILYLDADEKLTPGNALRVREIIRNKDIMAVNMIEHIPQEKGNLFRTTASDYCRLFRNDPRLTFTGRVHEQILPSINDADGKVLRSDIRIDHWGFGATPERKKNREERNLRLLQLDLADRPDDPFIYFNIGMTYAAQGDKVQAIGNLLRAVEIDDPTMRDTIRSGALAAVAQIYFSDDDTVNAKTYAEKALEYEQTNYLAYYILSAVEFQKEDFAEAEKYLLRIEQLIDDNTSGAELNKAQLYIDLGNCAFKTGDLDSAIQRYKRAESFGEETLELFFNLGTCYLNTQDFLNAESCFRKARPLAEDMKLIDDILDELEKVKNPPQGPGKQE
ncbi:glycosyltransferase [candidate division KSB1 bacterium]